MKEEQFFLNVRRQAVPVVTSNQSCNGEEPFYALDVGGGVRNILRTVVKCRFLIYIDSYTLICVNVKVGLLDLDYL